MQAQANFVNSGPQSVTMDIQGNDLAESQLSVVNLEDISQCEIANRDSSQNLAKETACVEETATKTESAASDR